MLTTFDGFPLSVSRHLCQMTFAGWRRTNRNNRIARKWRKRYGPLMTCRSEKAYRFDGKILACPHVADKMAAALKAGKQPC